MLIVLDDAAQGLVAAFPCSKVCLEPKDVPQNVALPNGWDTFGLHAEIKPAFPGGWNLFSNEFPSTIALLNNCLLGTALLLGTEVEMAYVFHDGNDFYYYVGGSPVQAGTADTSRLEHLPHRLQDFHREVHDGYTFFPARSMGPKRLCDQLRVSALVDEEDHHLAQDWITVFSNGGGDYVAVEANNRGSLNGMIWWHEDPTHPEICTNIFEVMDAWMKIFLEDTKPRAELCRSC